MRKISGFLLHRRQNSLRCKGSFAKSHANGIEDRIADRRRRRNGRAFTGTQRLHLGPVDQDNVQLRQVGKAQDRVGRPVKAGYPPSASNITSSKSARLTPWMTLPSI